MMDLTCSFFVVVSGNPSFRSNRIWWPKIDNVPVPVRSFLTTPCARICSIRSWYWRMGRLWGLASTQWSLPRFMPGERLDRGGSQGLHAIERDDLTPGPRLTMDRRVGLRLVP